MFQGDRKFLFGEVTTLPLGTSLRRGDASRLDDTASSDAPCESFRAAVVSMVAGARYSDMRDLGSIEIWLGTNEF